MNKRMLTFLFAFLFTVPTSAEELNLSWEWFLDRQIYATTSMAPRLPDDEAKIIDPYSYVEADRLFGRQLDGTMHYRILNSRLRWVARHREELRVVADYLAIQNEDFEFKYLYPQQGEALRYLSAEIETGKLTSKGIRRALREARFSAGESALAHLKALAQMVEWGETWAREYGPAFDWMSIYAGILKDAMAGGGYSSSEELDARRLDLSQYLVGLKEVVLARLREMDDKSSPERATGSEDGNIVFADFLGLPRENLPGQKIKFAPLDDMIAAADQLILSRQVCEIQDDRFISEARGVQEQLISFKLENQKRQSALIERLQISQTRLLELASEVTWLESLFGNRSFWADRSAQILARATQDILTAPTTMADWEKLLELDHLSISRDSVEVVANLKRLASFDAKVSALYSSLFWRFRLGSLKLMTRLAGGEYAANDREVLFSEVRRIQNQVGFDLQRVEFELGILLANPAGNLYLTKNWEGVLEPLEKLALHTCESADQEQGIAMLMEVSRKLWWSQ